MSQNCYSYLIIRNAEASLVEMESRDRHYKRILLLLHIHGCNMNVTGAFYQIIMHHSFLRLKSGIKYKKLRAISYIFDDTKLLPSAECQNGGGGNGGRWGAQLTTDKLAPSVLVMQYFC